MNENVGTNKLLTINRGNVATGLKLVLAGDKIAVRFGSRSSGIALVDSTADRSVKQILFQVTYAEAGHREMCLGFLTSGEDKEQVKSVFVDRVLPEIAERVPEWQNRIKQVNYDELVPRSAIILPHLTEDSYEQLLYHHEGGSGVSDGVCLLIDSLSSEAGTRITTVSESPQNLDQLSEVVKQLPDPAQSVLTETRKSLGELLGLSKADQMGDGDDPISQQLAYHLHNLALSKKSEAFQQEFARLMKPALQAYAQAIIAEFPPSGGTVSARKGAVLICDSLFGSEFCRVSLVRDYLAGFDKPIRFVNDPGLLGFLGALVE